MMLRYFAERRVTPDIDASIRSDTDLDVIIGDISVVRGWPPDWLNSAAAGFVPFGGPADWIPIHDDDLVSIWIASPECLLAMKLKAARRGRDDEDVAILSAHLGLASVEEAEAIFETYYPGELPPTRAYAMLTDIFAVGLPQAPAIQAVQIANPRAAPTRPQ